MKAKIKKMLFVVFLLFTLWITAVAAPICFYLMKYGYGILELPQAMSVYLGFTEGVTIGTSPQGNIFIGRHDYIYNDIFADLGYYEYDRMGTMGYYKKTGNVGSGYDFYVYSMGDWCHWFRIYEISSPYKIEDFI